MTIHERMVARSEREKDLLKYGRSQERERIIKLLEEMPDDYWTRLGGFGDKLDRQALIELIKRGTDV